MASPRESSLIALLWPIKRVRVCGSVRFFSIPQTNVGPQTYRFPSTSNALCGIIISNRCWRKIKTDKLWRTLYKLPITLLLFSFVPTTFTLTCSPMSVGKIFVLIRFYTLLYVKASMLKLKRNAEVLTWIM